MNSGTLHTLESGPELGRGAWWHAMRERESDQGESEATEGPWDNRHHDWAADGARTGPWASPCHPVLCPPTSLEGTPCHQPLVLSSFSPHDDLPGVLLEEGNSVSSEEWVNRGVAAGPVQEPEVVWLSPGQGSLGERWAGSTQEVQKLVSKEEKPRGASPASTAAPSSSLG